MSVECDRATPSSLADQVSGFSPASTRFRFINANARSSALKMLVPDGILTVVELGLPTMRGRAGSSQDGPVPPDMTSTATGLDTLFWARTTEDVAAEMNKRRAILFIRPHLSVGPLKGNLSYRPGEHCWAR